LFHAISESPLVHVVTRNALAVLIKRIHITKRDLFYTDVKLFVDQADSDGVLDDLSTMIGCTRSNLNVVASDKGLVAGRIQFEEDGDAIDCTKMGVGGKAIPPYIDKIENIVSDAEFILLIEKEAVYMRLAVSTKCIAHRLIRAAS
jgi:meiotic recombination protein SPO11